MKNSKSKTTYPVYLKLNDPDAFIGSFGSRIKVDAKL